LNVSIAETADDELMGEREKTKSDKVGIYRSRMESAQGFNEIWELVRETVKDSLGEHRVGMMLFLDDLPLQLGAYHPLGTNNIVLNRTLVQIVEAATQTKQLVNAFVYSLLVHEYLHALGHVQKQKFVHLYIKCQRNVLERTTLLQS
jgi:hypothetical protein